MPLRTYALFDVIGIKQAMAKGDAASLLGAFWRATEDWTNGKASSLRARIFREHAEEQVRPIVRTYSDSALLRTVAEYEIEDFFQLVFSLKEALDRVAGRAYVIVNRDDEIQAARPAMVVEGGDREPSYLNVSGSGPAFVNLYLADDAVHRAPAGWHEKYAVYCVGEESRPPVMKTLDSCAIRNCARPLLALA